MALRIVELAIDEYRSNINHRTTIPDPTWSDIEDAVNSLDGDACSSMALINSDGNVLAIGGGEPLYYVSLDTDEHAYVLTNGGTEVTPREIVVGGVDTALPSNCLVDLEQALSAAHSFWSGTLKTDSAGWELA